MNESSPGPDAPRVERIEGARQWFWVVAGAAGLLLAGAGAAVDMQGLLETGARWWRLLLTLPGLALLLVAWLRLGPSCRRPRLVLTIWVAVQLLAPPLHSRDAYSYAAQGWLLDRGLDPYVVPSGLAGDPGLLVGVHWFRTTSVYPPLSLEVFGWISNLFNADLWWTPLGMRLPNVVAMVVLALVLPVLARRAGVDERMALWLGLLNPVVVLQWVGGIHNDAIMVAVLAVAFLVAQDAGWRGYRGMLAGGAMIGVAMGLKQSAAVAGLGVVALAWQAALPELATAHRNWWAIIRRCLAAGGLAVVVFVGLSLATGLGFGWNNPTAGSPLAATSNAPISWVASFGRYHELMEPEQIITVLTAFTTLLIAAAMVWLVIRYGPRPPEQPGRPWIVAVGALLAFAFLGPALQPWYLTWVAPFIPLAGLSRRSLRLWFVAVAAAAVIPALQDVMAPYVAMFILVVPAFWLWHEMGRRKLVSEFSVTSG